MATECQSCHQPIEWVYTEGGKRMPIDPPGTLRKVMVEVARHTDGSKIVGFVDQLRSHFASCPDAPKHRKQARNPAARTDKLPI